MFAGVEGEGALDAWYESGLDLELMEFVEVCWDEGEGVSLPTNAKCGLVHRFPHLRLHFVGTGRLLAAWRKSELPCRAPPHAT